MTGADDGRYRFLLALDAVVLLVDLLSKLLALLCLDTVDALLILDSFLSTFGIADGRDFFSGLSCCVPLEIVCSFVDFVLLYLSSTTQDQELLDMALGKLRV